MTRKNKLTKKRIHEDEAFARTRENMSEFGRAGESNRLVREAFTVELQNISDRYVSGRLTKRMIRIIQSDPVRRRGERIVGPEALPMLEGFNFNRNKLLADTLYAPWYLYQDHAAGLFKIQIPFFNAGTMVDTQTDAIEYRLIACAAAIDFENRDVNTVTQQSHRIQVNDTTTRSIQLGLTFPAGNPHPVIITLGVKFFGMGISKSPAPGGTLNTMAVIKVVTG